MSFGHYAGFKILFLFLVHVQYPELQERLKITIGVHKKKWPTRMFFQMAKAILAPIEHTVPAL